jgi:hypothetical protein
MKAVDKFEQGKTIQDKKYTVTGLEYFTEEGWALKVAFREDAYDAVLQEQVYPYQRGCCGSFLLAHAYHQVSADAQQRAIGRARQVRSDVVAPYLICTDSVGAKNNKKKQSRISKK